MPDSRTTREPVQPSTRLDFSPEIEADFRQALRGRLRLTRTVMFLIMGLGFLLAPAYNHIVLQVSEPLLPFMLVMELAVVAPVMLAAALATFYSNNARLVRLLQLAGAVVALGAILVVRLFALEGGLSYPASMTGVILIGLAIFGGFHWPRVAAATLLFIPLAIALEIWKQNAASAPLLQIYPLVFMAIIAVLGSYVHERLTRRNWWDLWRLREAQSALRESERRFEAFMDHTPAIAWIKDAESRYVYRNKAHRDRYGQPGEDWKGRSDADYFPMGAVDVYRDTDREVLLTGQPLDFETSNQSRDGSSNDWLIQKFPFTDDSGRRYVAGIGVDVGERKRLEQKLRESESRFQAFLDNSPVVSWMKDEDGRYLYASESFRKFLGISDDRWRGLTDAEFFPGRFAQAALELDQEVLRTGTTREVHGDARDAQGVNRHWLLTRFRFTDGAGRRYLGGVANDITVRKRAEDVVRLQSLTDELTGLYNRRGFSLHAEQQLRQARRMRARCALLYVDLDGLKHINELNGHDGGDQAIACIGEALRVAVRSGDIIARVGGDEFVVFAIDCEDVPVLRQRVLDAIAEYNRSESMPFRLSASIGVAEFQVDETTSLDEKMTQADLQMMAAKRARQT